ncbi:toxin glutamine deamidase domain-containing protein [Streptomyces lydicus]|nr:toxin glutamine deamidase domain-containing protein [Streptomyces lydicus]
MPPDTADQQALVNAIPRHDDGTPQRFPDPFGDWSQLQNDGGTNVPGRSNNCADCSRSFLETWYGNPQVSAPRTPDLAADGTPDHWSPEKDANENIIGWTGAPHSYAGTSPDGHAVIARDLLQAGPGSSAIVQVNWDGGGGHAFNAVNHNGRIVWVDTQSGEVSEQPIHTKGATDVFYIPLDADRNPLHPAQDPASDSHPSQESDPSQKSDASQESDPSQDNHATSDASGPADHPAGDASQESHGNHDVHASNTAPHTPAEGTPDTGPGSSSGGHGQENGHGQSSGPEAPGGKRKASDPPPTDHQPSGSGAGSSSEHGNSHKRPRTEPDHDGLAALKLDDASSHLPSPAPPSPPEPLPSSPSPSPSPKSDDDAMDVDTKEPYSDPHDRGDSDTSEQERRGDRTLDAEPEGAKEYGIAPDRLQNELRRDRDVHRVPLDNVHAHLDSWAKDGNLAEVLRASTGDATPSSLDAGKGPRAFTQSDLEQRLPGFKDLERGERLAVVSSLARLSVGFHEQHGVGKNPEHVDKPYRKEGEGDPKPESPDSAAKNSDESLGVRGHRKSSDKLLNGLKLGTIPPSLKHNSPDLTDRNYAVLEVEGPPPGRETHYVTDSSVPVGEKYVSGRHSEKHLAEWLKRVNGGNGTYTPKAVYTEREPCGMGQGHAKCSTVLRDKTLDGSKVYYSTTYRTDPADVAAKKKLDTEKTVEKRKVDKMSAADVQQSIADRINARSDKSTERAAKEIAAAQKLSEADARKELKKLIEREYSKRKENSTTEEKQAMVREMDRHIEHLSATWRKIQPSLS